MQGNSLLFSGGSAGQIQTTTVTLPALKLKPVHHTALQLSVKETAKKILLREQTFSLIAPCKLSFLQLLLPRTLVQSVFVRF